MSTILFQNRQDAGRQLATKLLEYEFRDPAVLALPRGGVPIAAVVASSLKVLLGVAPVRKLGVPWQPELAFGALAATNGKVARVLNESLISQLSISQRAIQEVESRERHELYERQMYYRQFCQPIPLENRSVLLVDDGLATGSSMQAAIAAVRLQNPAEVVVVTPVIAPDSIAEMSEKCEKLIYLAAPHPFEAVGYYYEEFEPPSDVEIKQLLTATCG